MKTFLTIVAVALMSGLAGAADFAGLQGLNAAGIPKVNPFPNPGNPDSCYLTGLKDGLCNFKCRSGETFSVKPVKPEAQGVYEKCGGGDYRAQQIPDAGAILAQINQQQNQPPQPMISPEMQFALEAASELRKDLKGYGVKAKVGLVNEPGGAYGLWVEFKNWSDYEKIKDLFYQDPGENPSYMDHKVYPRVPKGMEDKGITVNIGKEQVFNSYGSYATEGQARQAMDSVIKNLNSLKATKVLDFRTVKNSLLNYSFEVKFRSIQTLGVYRHAAAYRTEEEAAEAMAGLAESLAAEKKTAVALEVVREGFNKYSFTVSYLSLEINIPLPVLREDKALKACVLSGYADNVCSYKCSDGSAYTQPFMTPGPWNNEPVVLCPQIVFPF